MVTDDGIPGQRRRPENRVLGYPLIPRCAPMLRDHWRCGAHTVWMRLWLVSWPFLADTSLSVSTPSRTIVFHVKKSNQINMEQKHTHTTTWQPTSSSGSLLRTSALTKMAAFGAWQLHAQAGIDIIMNFPPRAVEVHAMCAPTRPATPVSCDSELVAPIIGAELIQAMAFCDKPEQRLDLIWDVVKFCWVSASFHCQCTLASRVTVRCICVEGNVRSPRAKTLRIHCASGCLLVTRSAECAFVCSSTKFASCVVVVSFLCALPRGYWSEVSVRPPRMLGGVPPTL